MGQTFAYKKFNDQPNSNPSQTNQPPPLPNSQPNAIPPNQLPQQNQLNSENQPQFFQRQTPNFQSQPQFLPEQIQPHNPLINPYGYRENLGVNYHDKNQSNEKNRIYIARNCFGSYISREFTPALTFNRISQKEFNHELEKINETVSHFKHIKYLYLLMLILIVFSLGILITGISLDPELSIVNYSEKFVAQYIESQDEAYNILIGLSFIFLTVIVMIFSMAVFCTLKKYEFRLAEHFIKINRDSYLTRNVYWKIGGFCRFIEINILPIQPEFFWFLQTKNGQNLEINNIKEILKI